MATRTAQLGANGQITGASTPDPSVRTVLIDDGGNYIAQIVTASGGSSSSASPSDAVQAVEIIAADVSATPIDSASIVISVIESSAGPNDGATLQVTAADASATPNDATQPLRIVVVETSATPTEGVPSLTVIQPVEQSAAPIDGAKLQVSANDSSATPTDARDTFIRCYCSSAAGTNVTNPTNAQGQQDGLVATMAPSLTQSTATLTCTIGGIPTSGTFTSKKLCLWINFTAAKGALDTWSFTYTSTTITTAQTITGLPPAAATSYLTTPFVFDVSSLTIAQLQGLKIIFSDTSALGDSYTVDAVALVLEGGI